MATRSVDIIIAGQNRTRAAFAGANRGMAAMRGQMLQLRNVALGGVGIYALVREFREGITAAREFEKQLASVSTMLSGEAMKYVALYQGQLIKLSVETGQSTETLSKGLYDLLSASVAAGDAMDVLRIAAKGAIGGMTETATSVKAVVRILRAYNKEASEATEITDLLFTIVKKGVITYEELAENIGTVAPTANAAGLSLKELGAAIATVVTVEEPARGMTALKTAIFEAAEEGVNLLDFVEKFRGADLEEIIAAGIPKKAAQGIVILANNFELLQRNIDAMHNTAGASAEAYGKMADTAAQKAAKAGQGVKAIWRDISEGPSAALTAVNEVIAANHEAIATTIKWGVALGGLAVGVKIIRAINTYMKEQIILSRILHRQTLLDPLRGIAGAPGKAILGIGMALGPAGLAVAGFAAVVGGAFALIAHEINKAKKAIREIEEESAKRGVAFEKARLAKLKALRTEDIRDQITAARAVVEERKTLLQSLEEDRQKAIKRWTEPTLWHRAKEDPERTADLEQIIHNAAAAERILGEAEKKLDRLIGKKKQQDWEASRKGVVKFVGALKLVGEAFPGLGKTMAEWLKDMPRRIAVSAQLDLERDIRKATEAIKEQTLVLGLTADAAERLKFVRRGASKEQLAAWEAELAKLKERREELRKADVEKLRVESLKGWAEGIRESLKTPVELFKEYREKLAEAVREGFLGEVQMAAALQKRMGEMMGAGPVPAVERGFLTRAPGRYDPQAEMRKRLAETAKSTAETTTAVEESNGLLSRIAEKLGITKIIDM